MKPWSTEIELVRGCNLNCDFCGNHSLPKEHAFMSMDTVAHLAFLLREFGPHRIELVGRGEPLLHEYAAMAISMLRVQCTQAQISLMTNGTLLRSTDNLLSLGRAGLNLLVVDCYTPATRERVAKLLDDIGAPCYIYGVDKVNPWHYGGSSGFKVVLVDDSVTRNKATRKMYSRCGAVPEAVYERYGIVPVVPSVPLKKMCAKPFRHLMVHYDGGIPLCCMDWVRELLIADVMEIEDLEAFWEGSLVLGHIRRSLLKHDRAMVPCNKCDYPGGQRMGLIPEFKNLQEDHA